MIQEINPPKKPKIIKQKGNLAIFEIEACSPGYGITLGNALRRVLLSSLKGAAVTEVKISGVAHEFSTIPFVKEDVIQIILNLKKIDFKLYSDEPVTVFLEKKGESVVKASDIKLSTGIEVMNKDLHIATLTSPKAELNVEIKVEKGLGYVPVQDRKKTKKVIGVIALDANFSPIKRVNYYVENMRVGTRTDFNRLILEIETNGAISPKQAFTEASDLLIQQFKAFANPESVKKGKRIVLKSSSKKVKTKTKASQQKTSKSNAKPEPIEALNLDPRIIKSLHKARIKSVSNLAKKTSDYLLQLEDLGPKSIKSIRRELGKRGIILRES